MDRKNKKRIAVLRERLHKLERMLAGARQQHDDPKEVEELREDVEKTRRALDMLIDA